MMIVTLDVANAQAKRVCICICRVHAFSAGDLHGVCMVMWLLCGEFEVRERLVRVMVCWAALQIGSRSSGRLSSVPQDVIEPMNEQLHLLIYGRPMIVTLSL